MVSGGADWPNGQHGMCGDPAAGPRPHEAGGSLWTGAATGVYEEGSVLDLKVTVTAFHKGRFSFRVCRIEGAGEDRGSGGRLRDGEGAQAGRGCGRISFPVACRRTSGRGWSRCNLNILLFPAMSAGADVASERAQLTEACLDRNILRQANVPGAQVGCGAAAHVACLLLRTLPAGRALNLLLLLTDGAFIGLPQAPGDPFYHLGQTSAGPDYQMSFQLPPVRPVPAPAVCPPPASLRECGMAQRAYLLALA